MMHDAVSDRGEREKALAPDHSFIVQAPAGSGKTGLLTQRYLRLLATVEYPEEIIAITFTRKAVAEMRGRILEALDRAGGTEPDQAHERLTWRLAREALVRDREQGWELGRNPARLRIQTIDALCASLTRQMPLLSNFGGQPGVAEEPSELYAEAACNTLRSLEEGEDWSEPVAGLLRHLNNDIARVEGLLSGMLGRRDQWLRHIVGGDGDRLQRQELEAALERVVTDALELLRGEFPEGLEAPLLDLARYAASNLKETVDGRHPLLHCLDLRELPGTSSEDLAVWCDLAEFLLTKEGTLRKSVSVRNGFPASGSAPDAEAKRRFKEQKAAFGDLRERLSEQGGWLARLAQVRALPPIRYSDGQWTILKALFRLLHIAVAHLRLVMAERGEVDFIEIAAAALEALGTDEAPTDLALSLDYRIRHLLVDEFQDTSFGQFELLKRLTAGWEPGDGRTLFVVGDPMQSIYRFREAEVGLYLRARHESIGPVRLTPLTLCVNFRSQEGVVDWVNRAFERVLPQREDIAKGAVTYASSQAAWSELAGRAVSVHPFIGRDDAAEAGRVVALVTRALAEDETGDVAILVRNRSHLKAIVPRLKAAGLRFQAMEVEPLSERPVVHDLKALTRALLHPADRIAWLALLRAPWCGLTLADLLWLSGDEQRLSIWELMQQKERCARLSPEGQICLERLRQILSTAFSERRRRPLRNWIEGVWVALGGPAVLDSATGLEEARMFFELLQSFDDGGELRDFAMLEKAAQRLYAPPDVEADGRILIMTLHKAKGLEFDTVIVPGLGLRPRQDDSALLQWLERTTHGGHSDLLLAPIKSSVEDWDPIYRYLRGYEATRGCFEEGRLLYVAATRAKRRLHLLGHTGYDEKNGQLRPPVQRSLLASLWPAVEEEFQQADTVDHSRDGAEVTAPTLLRRLPPDWGLPLDRMEQFGEEIAIPGIEGETEMLPLEFDWAGEAARHVGTLVHRYLQRIAREGVEQWGERRVRTLRPAFGRALANSGVRSGQLEAAATKVETALIRLLSDERGRWLLSSDHVEPKSEYALSAFHQGRLIHIIIDRTFIDREGVRWIIDYKTGVHEGGEPDTFLDREQERYRPQLEGYAALFRKKEQRPLRVALYFPLLSGWREWEPL